MQFAISARTSFIPPEDPSRRFERYANQTGQPPGQTGNVPAAGVSPIPGAPQTPPSAIVPIEPVIGPGGQTQGNFGPGAGHTGQVPAAGLSPTSNAPGAPQIPPSAISPTKPVIGPGGQKTGSIAPAPAAGHTGNVPEAGVSTIPEGSAPPQLPPSAILPTKPVIGPGGQTPGNIAPAPGHAGRIPAVGTPPIPGGPKTSPSAILPTKPVVGQEGQTPGSSLPANQPASSSSGNWPTKSTGLGYGPEPATPLVPLEGKVALQKPRCILDVVVL